MVLNLAHILVVMVSRVDSFRKVIGQVHSINKAKYLAISELPFLYHISKLNPQNMVWQYSGVNF